MPGILVVPMAIPVVFVGFDEAERTNNNEKGNGGRANRHFVCLLGARTLTTRRRTFISYRQRHALVFAIEFIDFSFLLDTMHAFRFDPFNHDDYYCHGLLMPYTRGYCRKTPHE